MLRTKNRIINIMQSLLIVKTIIKHVNYSITFICCARDPEVSTFTFYISGKCIDLFYLAKRPADL